MKKTKSLLSLVAAAGAGLGASAAESLFLEAEAFQFPGGWSRVSDRAASGRYYLQAPQEARDPASDALTAVTLDREGDYTVWALSRDYARDRPKTRTFEVLVDGVPLRGRGGAHGREGFAWEALGSRTLKAGDHALALRRTDSPYGRCDALFITRADVSPEALPGRKIIAFRVTPKPLPHAEQATFRAERLTDVGTEALAALSTPSMRVTFVAAKDAAGKPWIARRAQVLCGGAWQELPEAGGSEALFVLQATNVTADLLRAATWKGARTPVDVPFNGTTFKTAGAATDPYTAAPSRRFAPREVVSAEGAGVVLRYEAEDGESLPVRWETDPDEIGRAHV